MHNKIHFVFFACLANRVIAEDDKKESIAIDSHIRDFAEIRYQPGFMDKSLLIEAVLNDSSRLFLSAPRRSGKSVNMSMLKRFFEILPDQEALRANRKLFEGLQIEKYESIMNEHFGKHPVIFLDFKSSGPIRSSGDVAKHICNVVHAAYKSHAYLQETNYHEYLYENEDDDLEDWLRDSADYTSDPGSWDFVTALDKLVRFLIGHFSKKVFVLVDEYGSIWSDGVISADDQEELQYVSNLYENSLYQVLLNSLSGEVERVILAGIFEQITMKLIKKHYITLQNITQEECKFSKFYGNYSKCTLK